MKIIIAGAGSGKTTSMVSTILNEHRKLSEHQIIYCIAFTNNAIQCIKERLQRHFPVIPSNIHISTIHSFLYTEIIRPYHHLLYDKYYNKISISELPNNIISKQQQLIRLDKLGFIHQTSIPQKSKWILVRKSNDNKLIKNKRNIIHNTLKKYCSTICLDEAQDMDNDMYEIFKQLNKIGINIIMMGDPKQDLRGLNNLRKLIKEYPSSVSYKDICYRCPQKHLSLSNSIIPKEETQLSDKMLGSINLFYESLIDYPTLTSQTNYDLIYISSRRGPYETQSNNKSKNIKNTIEEDFLLEYKELFPYESDKELQAKSYYSTEKLLKYLSNKNISDSVDLIMRENNIYSYNFKKKIIDILSNKCNPSTEQFSVNSIDSIKGQEGNTCLFILSKDLAPYLFQENEKNSKIKNRLYVALTRSLCILNIYVLKETEDLYGKDAIDKFFKGYI